MDDFDGHCRHVSLGSLASRGGAEFEDSDERGLGGGDFVAGLHQEGLLEPHAQQKIELPTLEQNLSGYYDLPHLQHRGRQNRASQGRAAFCYCAVSLQGYSGVEVGRYLNIGKASVSRALPKGEAVIGRDDALCRLVDKLIKQQRPSRPPLKRHVEPHRIVPCACNYCTTCSVIYGSHVNI